MALRIPSRSFPGPLNAYNKISHWSWSGFLAYPCQNLVVVVEPTTVQVVQTLEHKAPVTRVEWSREYYHHSLSDPYCLHLASADSSGKITVWNAREGEVQAEFAESAKPIIDMKWLANDEMSRDLLAVLHHSSALIVWNADTGVKVWKQNLSESPLGFSLDPFNYNELAVLSSDCLLFVCDFSGMKPPLKPPKKFYVSGGGGSSKKASVMKKVRQQLVGDGRRSEESLCLSDCLQMVHSPSCHHHLFLVYPREILVLDLQVHQTVGSIPIERNGSSFQQLVAARQRDVLFCLHENGCVSVRTRRRHLAGTSSSAPTSPSALSQRNFDVIYDLRCQSDPLRLSKQNRAVHMCLDPVFEQTISLLLVDGRVLFWRLLANRRSVSLSLPSSPTEVMNWAPPLVPNAEPGQEEWKGQQTNAQFTLADLFTSLSLPTERIEGDCVQVALKLTLCGLLQSASPPPLCLRMCPPLTTKNWNIYKPLLAAGTSTGVVQVFNLLSSHLYKEFSVHTSAVKGIDWLDLNAFITYSSSSSNSLGQNELKMTKVSTGKIVTLRNHKEDELPIEAIQVSNLKQFFLLLIKDKPIELWDVSTLTVIREISTDGRITAMTWSPAHGHQRTTLPGSGATTKEGKAGSKEYFVLADSSSMLRHYSVDMGSCREAPSKVPIEGGLGTITALAWKNERLVLGDADGQLGYWELKGKSARTIPAHRSLVKKIKFAPGKGNLIIFALFNNGSVDIIDTDSGETQSTMKPSKEGFSVQDVEWAASDSPVVALSNGCVSVVHFLRDRFSNNPITSQHSDPFFCPRILLPQTSFFLKSILQHQPWNKAYSLDLTKSFGEEETMDVLPRTVHQHLKALDSSVKRFLVNPPFGTSQRCLLVSRLFGDECEAYFWEVVLCYLLGEKEKRKNPSFVPLADIEPVNPTSDIFRPESTPPLSEGESDTLAMHKNSSQQLQDQDDKAEMAGIPVLDTCYDLLLSPKDFHSLELRRLALHDTKRVTYEHTQKCAEKMIYLKQTDRAVQLLLETASENDQYYTDALRACLVATIRSSGVSQSTIKLVATNLIANGKLSEGVQLLSLIDKGLDASRYLQTYGEWNQAAFLAKSSLSERECAEVFSRWAEHLASPTVNQKANAVLLFVSLGQFSKVLEMLYSMRWFDTAALFAEVCLEFGLLDNSHETKALIEAVFLEYARFQLILDNKIAARFYCLKAGENGAQLIETESFGSVHA
eukprot:m.49863 g.49863  ORF g.49863 m.49863 type:complete len:1222 (+) comp34038_c1_seq1:279-3944(+)